MPRRRSSPAAASTPSTRSAPCARSTRAPARRSGEPDSDEKGGARSLYGGGIAFDNGRIYATNGLGYVAALDARNGGIVWQVGPGGPLRGAPTVANDTVYVISQDNQIYSLKEADGATNWSQAAVARDRRRIRLGLAGRRAGHRRRRLFLGRAQRLSLRERPPGVAGRAAAHEHPTSVSSLSDIDADPVIDSGQVIAVGQGGRMVALDLVTGQRQWELNLAGISTPWVAGDWMFVVTDEAKLLCV